MLYNHYILLNIMKERKKERKKNSFKKVYSIFKYNDFDN